MVTAVLIVEVVVIVASLIVVNRKYNLGQKIPSVKTQILPGPILA